MPEEVILLHDVLEAMDTGKAFSMSYVTADRKRGTGGELKEVTNWAKFTGDPDDQRLPGQFIPNRNETRSPDHFKNRTVNIFNPNNRHAHIEKVHWRLILFFNGKRVIN